MAFNLKQLLRDKRAWAVAGIGAAGGLFLAARARRGAGTATGGIYDPGAPAVTGQASTYDSSLADIWEGFTQTAGGLQGQIDEINAVLQGDTPTSPTSSQPSQPKPSAVPMYEIHKIKGTWNLRQLAARFAPSRDPNSIEATLRRIVALNPSLRGKTSITTGGFDLKTPRYTRVA